MRDFRDAKRMAASLRKALGQAELTVSHSHSLELIAKAFGVENWNVLAAKIRAAEAVASETGSGLPVGPSARAARPSFSPELERTLHRTVGLARQRRHERAMLEHLLLALTEDGDARSAMEACGGDPQALKGRLSSYLDHDLPPSPEVAESPGPSAGFQRVIQRAVLHVQASDRTTVTGAELLVAIFSEEESQAARSLADQGLTRVRVVKFLMERAGLGGEDGSA